MIVYMHVCCYDYLFTFVVFLILQDTATPIRCKQEHIRLQCCCFCLYTDSLFNEE